MLELEFLVWYVLELLQFQIGYFEENVIIFYKGNFYVGEIFSVYIICVKYFYGKKSND